jgi:FtsP/CotA-like multicopper oxidase with cupredoxin domain
MTALYFRTLRPEDRVAVKPHASPNYHAASNLDPRVFIEKHLTATRYSRFGSDQSWTPIHTSRKCPGGHGGYNRWTINGKSWPAANPLFTTQTGKRHRIAMTNKSGDNHPVHLHRHSFEISVVGEKATAGVMKDTVNMTRFSTVEIDFVADDPGPTPVITRITRTTVSWAW